MVPEIVYFDHAASTVVDSETIKQISMLLKNNYANPSSTHNLGVETNNIISHSRSLIASHFNVGADSIYFANSATVAANILIQGYCNFLLNSNSERNEIIISEIEHPAVYKTIEFMKTKGFQVRTLEIEVNGKVSIAQLKKLINNKTAMVAVMAVNNEIGVIQDIFDLSIIVKDFSNDILFLSDFVQGVGKIPISYAAKVDAWFVAGHKIGTPKGIACFYLNPKFRMCPILFGGGQESGMFPGTSDSILPNILSNRIKHSLDLYEQHSLHYSNLRAYLIEQLDKYKLQYTLTIPNEHSTPSIVSINFNSIKGAQLAKLLSQMSIFVSARSACSSSLVEESHVIKALNARTGLKISPIRISFSSANTNSEIDIFINALRLILDKKWN